MADAGKYRKRSPPWQLKQESAERQLSGRFVVVFVLFVFKIWHVKHEAWSVEREIGCPSWGSSWVLPSRVVLGYTLEHHYRYRPLSFLCSYLTIIGLDVLTPFTFQYPNWAGILAVWNCVVETAVKSQQTLLACSGAAIPSLTCEGSNNHGTYITGSNAVCCTSLYYHAGALEGI